MESTMADNPILDIACVCSLEQALALAFRGRRAVAYVIDEAEAGKRPERLILLWDENITRSGMVKFPAPLTAQAAAPLVQAWLDGAAYPKQAWSSDVEHDRSFRVYFEGWGHVGGMYQALCAVETYWALSGK